MYVCMYAYKSEETSTVNRDTILPHRKNRQKTCRVILIDYYISCCCGRHEAWLIERHKPHTHAQNNRKIRQHLRTPAPPLPPRPLRCAAFPPRAPRTRFFQQNISVGLWQKQTLKSTGYISHHIYPIPSHQHQHHHMKCHKMLHDTATLFFFFSFWLRRKRYYNNGCIATAEHYYYRWS